MRPLATLFLFLISLNSFADEYKNYWKAEIYQSGCVAILYFYGTFSSQNSDDSDPLVGVGLHIASPNSNYIGDEFERLEEGEANLLLLVQPQIWWTSSEKGIVVTHVSIKTPTGVYPTSSSTLLVDPEMLGFVIAGNSAQEVWRKIVAKDVVSIELELSTGVQYSIDIEGEYLDQVARMFAACVG
jgi:hypothetical protein